MRNYQRGNEERRGNIDRDCRERKQSEIEERITTYMMVKDGEKKKSYRKRIVVSSGVQPRIEICSDIPNAGGLQ